MRVREVVPIYLLRLIAVYAPMALAVSLAFDVVQWHVGLSNLGAVIVLVVGDGIGLFLGMFIVMPFVVLAAWGRSHGHRWPGWVVAGCGVVVGTLAAALTVWMLVETREVDRGSRVWDAWVTTTVALVAPVWGFALFLPPGRLARQGDGAEDRSSSSAPGQEILVS
jgi:hypothetical protein